MSTVAGHFMGADARVSTRQPRADGQRRLAARSMTFGPTNQLTGPAPAQSVRRLAPQGGLT